jgi:hypothetical protein
MDDIEAFISYPKGEEAIHDVYYSLTKSRNIREEWTDSGVVSRNHESSSSILANVSATRTDR